MRVHGVTELERGTPTLPPRNLGALLDETVAIYSKHFKRLIVLVAMTQVPVSIVSIAIFGALGGNTATYVAALLLGSLGTVIVYSAGATAVGQQYVEGEITIRICYSRAWWRIASLTILSILVAAILIAVVSAAVFVMSLLLSGRPLVLTLVVVIFVAVFHALILWLMAVNVVVMEGNKAVEAVRRISGLIRGSWQRVFGVSQVLGLAVIGLAILVTIPFAVASAAEAGLAVALQSVGGLVVEIVVPPVLFIAGTLLYYDMRVRKEQYDFARLSHEMGIAAV